MEIPKVTEDQLNIYIKLKDSQFKILVGKVMLSILVTLTITFILLLIGVFKSTWDTKLILGSVEVLLGYVSKPLTDHYFNASKAAKIPPVTRKSPKSKGAQ